MVFFQKTFSLKRVDKYESICETYKSAFIKLQLQLSQVCLFLSFILIPRTNFRLVKNLIFLSHYHNRRVPSKSSFLRKFSVYFSMFYCRLSMVFGVRMFEFCSITKSIQSLQVVWKKNHPYQNGWMDQLGCCKCFNSDIKIKALEIEVRKVSCL